MPQGIDPKFVVQLREKEFVLYAGVLDLAHQKGLRAIETELVQLPTKENEHTAVVKAIATLRSTMNDAPTRFTGYGDANPSNVNRPIAAHLIRMAETRAKARALRDAVNVGMTALEELGGDEEVEEKPKAKPVPHKASAPPEITGEAAVRLLSLREAAGLSNKAALIKADLAVFFDRPVLSTRNLTPIEASQYGLWLRAMIARAKLGLSVDMVAMQEAMSEAITGAMVPTLHPRDVDDPALIRKWVEGLEARAAAGETKANA